MPKYRALHTKIIDSFDVNDMPNDSTRYMWTLLFLVVDREGRGIDDPCWLKSKLYPMRKDVTLEQVEERMNWFAEKVMIRRYEVEGRKYFDLPTFKSLQPGTLKEAPSVLPSFNESLRSYSGLPPELLRSYSGVAPEEVQSNSGLKESKLKEIKRKGKESEDTPESTPDPFSEIQHSIEKITGIPAVPGSMQAIQEIIDMGAVPDDIKSGYDWLRSQGKALKYYGSLVGPTRTAMAKRLMGNNKWSPVAPPPDPYRSRDKPEGGYEVLPEPYKTWEEFDRDRQKIQSQLRIANGQTL